MLYVELDFVLSLALKNLTKFSTKLPCLILNVSAIYIILKRILTALCRTAARHSAAILCIFFSWWPVDLVCLLIPESQRRGTTFRERYRDLWQEMMLLSVTGNDAVICDRKWSRNPRREKCRTVWQESFNTLYQMVLLFVRNFKYNRDYVAVSKNCCSCLFS